MPKIDLGYGKSSVGLEYDENRFQVLGDSAAAPKKPLTDAQIGAGFDRPIGSPAVEDIVGPGESVLLVVPDATRQTASGQIVNLLVRRLIAAGTMPYDIRVIFATGIHRPATAAEKQELVTPFIAQRIKMLDHNPRDLVGIVRFGETRSGIPVELNRALAEHDHTVIIGGINFHYFAGFTGGRKLICPGLGSSRTISATHRLAFDCQTKSRRTGVGPARLDGNAVHEAFVEVVEKRPPSFSVNTIVDERGRAVEVFAGDWKEAHRAGCARFAAENTVPIAEKRDLVIVSCGGFPHDINMIQAHKALEAASRACRPGGTIVFLAECSNGLGREDFLDWFRAENLEELAERLCEKYQVNGQTAWSLLKKAEKFDVRIITELTEEQTARMRLQKTATLAAALVGTDRSATGYIIPAGAKCFVES